MPANTYTAMQGIIDENEYVQSNPGFMPQLLSMYGWTPQAFQAAQTPQLPQGFRAAGYMDGDNDVPNRTEKFIGSDGRTYIQSTRNLGPKDSYAYGDGFLTEYNADTQAGEAEGAKESGIFFGSGPSAHDLPVVLAASLVGAGVTGGLGALQGVPGTSLVPGFDLGGLNPSSGLSGGTGSESLIGGGVDTLPSPFSDVGYGTGAMDTFGAVNSPLGTGAAGTLGIDALPGLTGAGLNLPNVPPGATTAAQAVTQNGGAMDMTGSNNSPIPGAGQTGTVFQQGVGGAGSGTALSWLSQQLGIPEGVLSGLGTLGQTGLGIWSGLQQSDAITDIANQSRADRLPALNAFNSALQNPNTWYQSEPSMGAVDGVLRKLSMQGNPASNPGALSQAAAYNLGGYNDYLRGLSGPAFGTASNESNINLAGVGAQGGAWEAAGSGLESLLNPRYRLNLGGFGP